MGRVWRFWSRTKSLVLATGTPMGTWFSSGLQLQTETSVEIDESEIGEGLEEGLLEVDREGFSAAEDAGEVGRLSCLGLVEEEP